MDSVWEKVEAEKDLVEGTLAEIDKVALHDDTSSIILAGLSAFLHNFYNGVENILKQILSSRGYEWNRLSGSWHHDLLKAAGDHKIISEETNALLKDYLSFRHFFAHGYGILLQPKKLIPFCRQGAPRLGKVLQGGSFFLSIPKRFTPFRSCLEIRFAQTPSLFLPKSKGALP